jgi:hypothetical protein
MEIPFLSGSCKKALKTMGAGILFPCAPPTEKIYHYVICDYLQNFFAVPRSK